MNKTEIKILTDTDHKDSNKYNYHICIINNDKRDTDNYQRIIQSLKLNESQFKELKIQVNKRK